MVFFLRPVPILLFLSPLVAEYLLGDLTVSQLKLLPVMFPIYGGGALLIRDLARRTRRGWPAILILGLAYAIVEEALATQSLFNPHYLGLRLIDYGFIPALGIAAPWTVYVLTIHVVWSIAVPIALVEALFPERREIPWFGAKGLAAAAIVYIAGVALIFGGTRAMEHFMASPIQLAWAALAAAAVAAAAFVFVRPMPEAGRPPAPPAGMSPWIPGLLAFVLGSTLCFCTRLSSAVEAPVLTAIYLGISGAAVAAVAVLRRRPGWTEACADALGIGAVLVYAWWGFVISHALHGASSLAGHSVFVAALAGYLALVRSRRRAIGIT